jgi:hypothetical protein
MTRVRPNQIAHIGRYIRFNLTIKKYTHDRWKTDLFGIEDTYVSIKILADKLQKYF